MAEKPGHVEPLVDPQRLCTPIWYEWLGSLSGGISAASSDVKILNDDTAVYDEGGKYGVKSNPWNKGSAVRDVDFIERIEIYPNTWPNNTFISWTWPTGHGIGAIFSYSFIYPINSALGSAINTYTTITTSFDYVVSWNKFNLYPIAGIDNNLKNVPFNVLHEIWLDPGGMECMLHLLPRGTQVLPRTTGRPFASIEATTCAGGVAGIVQAYDIYSWFDVWQHFNIYPMMHTLTDADDNWHPNPTMSGSVVGVPGTDPTHFKFDVLGAGPGVTKAITGSGSVVAADGVTINFVDVQFSGPPTANATMQIALTDITTLIKSPPYQDWLISVYVAVISGDLTNIGNVAVNCGAFDSGSGFLFSGGAAPINAYLTTTPQKFGVQFGVPWGAAPYMAYITPFIQIPVTAGASINVTFRIGWPMLAFDTTQRKLSGKVDWLALFNAMIANGYLTGTEVMTTAYQFGVETTGSDGSISIRKFAVEIV